MRYFKLCHISTIFALGLFFTGCLNTEGTLEIQGKVIDEYTKMQLPWRDIIIHGLVKGDKELKPTWAGQFSTDSSGCFRYTFNKIRNAYY
jgi:hypothetical protein